MPWDRGLSIPPSRARPAASAPPAANTAPQSASESRAGRAPACPQRASLHRRGADALSGKPDTGPPISPGSRSPPGL